MALKIKQMNEQSRNITLEDINLANSRELQTISDLSSIRYEEKYQYLERNDTDKQHLLMKNIKLTPERKEYHVRFYQQLEFDPTDSLEKGDRRMVYQQKIGTVAIKPHKDHQTVIRLPMAKKPIAIEVKTEDTLNGYVSVSEPLSHEAYLYNKEGYRVGTLAYQVQRVEGKPQSMRGNPRLLSNLNQTLHSKDFEHQNLDDTINQNESRMLTKINEELKKTLAHIEQDEINQRQTEKINEIVGRRSKRKSIDGETSEAEFRDGQSRQSRKIDSRVASFRIPIATQEKQSLRPEIDWNSIRRCKEQLGLSHIDIESMLLPNKSKTNGEKSQSINRTNPELEQSTRKILQQIYKEHTLQKEEQFHKKYLNRQRQLERDDLSSASAKEELGGEEQNIGEIENGFRSIGVETYTPLPSLKASIDPSQSRFRSKAKKSASASSSIAQRKKPISQSSPKQSLKPLRLQSQELAIKIESQLLRSSSKHQAKKLYQQSEVFSININQLATKVPELPPIPISQLYSKPKPKLWESCLDTPINKAPHSEAQSEMEATNSYDVIITNISLQLDKNAPGCKYLYLSLGQTQYNTQQLSGNSLIWTGTNYRFQGTALDQITLVVKSQGIKKLSNYGKVRVKIADLLKNKRQNYYQSLVLNQQEVLGNIIIGFKLTPSSQIVNRYVFPRQNTSITQSYTEMRRDRQSKKEEATGRMESVKNSSPKRKKVLSPKQNPIKMRKYLGGKNIKIGRASRFGLGTNIFKPGPGDYEIESEFSRHAVKQY